MIGAISLVLFVTRQLKLDKPMLDFRVYRYPMFALSSVITILMNMALFSTIFYYPFMCNRFAESHPFNLDY